MDLTRAALAAMIDHTLLKPETTTDDVVRIATEGAELGVASVCIPASLVAFVPRLRPVSCVIGFPSGAHREDVKVYETKRAIEDGADEIDMVINLGAAHSGRLDVVASEIEAVRAACDGKTLKAILESATFRLDDLQQVAIVARDAGADFLKTSTGFHPAGGASIEAVKVLAWVAGQGHRRIGVKASGGIRDYSTALAMIDAGATRIGTSATRVILGGAVG